jgi:hypothetical protein
MILGILTGSFEMERERRLLADTSRAIDGVEKCDVSLLEDFMGTTVVWKWNRRSIRIAAAKAH